MKHTPGPWKVSDGCVQSELMNEYGNWIVCGIERELTSEDNSNLRLIAAAPRMIEALRVAAELQHYIAPNMGEVECTDKTLCVFCQAIQEATHAS